MPLPPRANKTMELTPRIATERDADEIAALVNRAYRPTTGTSGWTHEAQLVAGERSAAVQVLSLFRPQSHVLVLCDEGAIAGCVHVQIDGSIAYMGMLATDPEVQAQGVGKQMLLFAEDYAMSNYQPAVFRMSVLSVRTELMAFYERRGYVRAGEVEAYPVHAGVGRPLVEGLLVETLVKSAAPRPRPQPKLN
jgi:ribosomal protein S18 acetylase RimI-like enzyme